MRERGIRRVVPWLVALVASALGLSQVALAEIESVDLYLYGAITGQSKRQITRILSPYVEADSISFRQMERADGKEHPWVTIVTLTPRGMSTNFYQILHRIKDTRGVNDGRVLYNTEVTARGDLRAHFGWTRRSFGWIPGWVQARGLVTSGLWHHLRATGSGESLVFHPNEEYDRLRLAPHRGADVRVRGRIAGFDGPYPVVVLGEFEIIEREYDDQETYQQDIPRRIQPDRPSRNPAQANREY